MNRPGFLTTDHSDGTDGSSQRNAGSLVFSECSVTSVGPPPFPSLAPVGLVCLQEVTEATEVERLAVFPVSPVSDVFHVFALSVAPWLSGEPPGLLTTDHSDDTDGSSQRNAGSLVFSECSVTSVGPRPFPPFAPVELVFYRR